MSKINLENIVKSYIKKENDLFNNIEIIYINEQGSVLVIDYKHDFDYKEVLTLNIWQVLLFLENERVKHSLL